MAVGLACAYKRLTEAGNIKGSQGILYWLIVTNEDSDPAYVILNDAIAGTGSEVARFWVAGDRTELFNLDSAGASLKVGIRIGTFSTASMFVTGGYA